MSNVHDKSMNLLAQLLGKGAINKSIFQRKPKVVKEPIKEDVLEEPIKEDVLEEPIKEDVLEEPIKRNPGQYQIKVDAFIGKGEKLVILPDDFPPGNFNNKPVNKLNLIGRDVFTTRRDGQNLYIRCINPEQNGWRSKLIFCLEMTEDEYNNIVEKENMVMEESIAEENTYKSIELSNEVCSYITINNQSTSYGLDFVKNNQNPNIIDINLELYQYCNDLTIDTDIEIHKDIYNNGVPNGLIYSLKQIRNHIDDGEIEYREELSTGKKYITHNGENFEIKTFVNDIYSKPYETFIDDIKIIENHINVEHGVTPQIMCCFIGDAEVGSTLLDKIITSDKNEYTSLFVFRSLDIYDLLKAKLKHFTSRVIFKSKEYGNDIIPSLQALHWINTQYPNKIEYVYKIQTKSDKKWFDECTDYLLDYTNTKLIRMLGSDDTNSNCVGVPSQTRKIGQNGSCKTLIDKYKDDINQNRYFIAGTIFFCKMETIINVLRHIENNNYQSYFLNNCYDTNMVNITQSPPHFLERLFGGVNNNNDNTRLINDIHNYYSFDWKTYFQKIKKNTINKHIENNIIEIKNDNENNSVLFDYELILTNNYNIKHNFITLPLEKLDDVHDYIFVVDFPNGGGGTTIFLNKIISKYKKYNTFVIARNIDNKLCLFLNDEYEIDKKFNNKEALCFLDTNKSKFQKIFVNHTLTHNDDFLHKIFELNKETIFITHDYYSIDKNPQPYPHKLTENNNKYLNKYSKIITQNKCNLNVFNHYITNKNIDIIISDLPDYKETDTLIQTNNKNTVIGIIGVISGLKGKQILDDICKYFQDKNKDIDIVIFGDYKNNEKYKNVRNHLYADIFQLNNLLIQHKPNILLELSIWRETYSFTLTLGMITNLPILYSRKTGDYTVEDRLSKYDKSVPFDSIPELDGLIQKHKQNFLYTISRSIYYNSFWDKLFNRDNIKKVIHENYFNNLEIYPIYFPQFHTIIENNSTFYQDYNDIINLNSLPNSFESITPNLEEFNLTGMTEYNLLNTNIIRKQIDILNDYNYSGFAMYYFWFSKNTITKDHQMLMTDVIDSFFNDAIQMKGKKIYFLWCNESWSNNDAFGNTSGFKIENYYTETDINLNIDNLMKYFKHENYLKKENKPLFSIHHPWTASIEQIKLFEKILTTRCIENGFDGVHLLINSMNGDYNDLTTYKHNFNYKNKQNTLYGKYNKQIYLDFNNYYKEHIPYVNSTNMITFDFDNRARLSKPNKLKNSTICINNSEYHKIQLIKSMLYKELHSNLNIIFINSWNEWGERMAIEPSNEVGYYYLNLMNEYFGKD